MTKAERDAVIEECAKVADRVVANCDLTFDEEEVGRRIAYRIRTLKTAGQPSADGGKECEHDYEAHDDKGWECKKCGHQT